MILCIHTTKVDTFYIFSLKKKVVILSKVGGVTMNKEDKWKNFAVPSNSVITTTMEILLFLLWQWWCLLWICLVVSANMAVLAAGQGQCEVLDSNIQPSFSLPKNITLKPIAPGWLLDITLWKETLLVNCVRLQEVESRIQVTLFNGDCLDGIMKDYSYLSATSVPPHAWTTIILEGKNDTLLVTALSSISILLKTDNWLPSHNVFHVTMAKGVEVAVAVR